MSRMLGDLLSIFQTSKSTKCWLEGLVKANAVPTKTHYSWQPYFILLLIIFQRLFHSRRNSQNFRIWFTQNFINPELIRHPGFTMLGTKGNAGRAQTHYSWEADLWCGSLYLTNTNRKLQIEIHVEIRIEIHLEIFIKKKYK